MDRMKAIYFFSWMVSFFINRFKNPKKRIYQRILIIRLDDIGDMMTSLPAITALTKKYPETEITIWCTRLTAQLLKNYPGISHIIFSASELNGYYDLIIDLRGNFLTAWYALFHQPYCYLERGTARLLNKFMLPQHPHEIKINFQVMKPVLDVPDENYVPEIYPAEENQTAAEKFLSQSGIKKFAVFHPFSLKKLKEWNAEKFAALAVNLKEKFELDVIFAGAASEDRRIKEMQMLVPFKTFSFAGYGLLDLAALCSKASLFVGNDSGPMHIADAMKIPVIGLFGPGEPHLFSPSGRTSAFIHHKLECNPCDQVHCVHPFNPCMNRITVDEVLQKATGILHS